MIDKLFEFITSNSMDWAFDKLVDKKEKRELQAKIRDYISTYYSHVFYDLPFDEEFDFEGLNQYLTQQFESKIIVLFNSPNFSTRKQARELLFTESYYYAKAKTQNQQRMVYHYLTTLLNIIEKHFLDQIDNKQWFLGRHTLNEIEELLTSEIAALTAQLTERIDYRGSFAEMIDYMEQEPSNTYQFHYRNNEIRFHGRRAEIAALTEFLEEDRKISIAILTGPGGIGKSKLVYHFLNSYQYDFTWKMLFITQHDINKILQFHEWKYSKKLLLVVDYAGFMSKEIGEWILTLSRKSSSALPAQLKIILIERQGFSLDQSGQRIEPYWYRQLLGYGPQERAVKRHLFENEEFSPFLELSGLQRSDLYNIIDDYAEVHNRKLNLLQKEKIVKYVEEIEENDSGSRPLILLLVTDAYLSEKSLGSWRITDLMTNILDRYKNTWLNTLCDQDYNLYNDLEYMLAYATALGGWDIQGVGGAFQQPSKHLLALNSKRLIDLICGVNSSTEYRAHIAPIKPDLIGEFFVLEFLLENSVSKEKLQAIINELWQGHNFPMFLLHCISDYAQEPHYYELFKNGMNLLLPEEFESYQGATISLLLEFLCGMQKAEDCEETVNWLDWLKQKCPSKITLEAYAQGLFKLVIKDEKPSEKVKTHIALLTDLYQTHPSNKTPSIIYAKALYRAINEHNIDEAIELIQVFENNLICSEANPNMQVNLEYAKAILGILQCHTLDIDFVKDKLDQLRKLYESNEENELLDVYCYALLSTAHYFGISIEENYSLLALKNLALQNDIAEKKYLYAYALTTLSNYCTSEQIPEILRSLEDWAVDTNSQEIFSLYINFAFLHMRSLEPASASVLLKHIGDLAEEHEDNPLLILSYAAGLLSLYAKGEGSDDSIPEIVRDLAQKYGDMPELRFSLNATLHQIEMLETLHTEDGTQQVKETWNKNVPNAYKDILSNLDHVLLQKLISDYDIYRSDLDSAGLELIETQAKNAHTPEHCILYAMAVISVIQHSDSDTALSLLSKLRAFTDQYSNEAGIPFLYLQGLAIMLAKMDFRKIPFLINEIREFVEQHKKTPAIAMLYCTLLSPLLLAMDGEEAEDVFAQIQELCDLHIDTPGFADLKILSLGALTLKDEFESNQFLMEAIPSDNSISLLPMTAIMAATKILSAMEELEPDEKLSSLKKLCNLAAQYPNDEDIAEIAVTGFYEVSIDINLELHEPAIFMQLNSLIEAHGTKKPICSFLTMALHNFLVKQTHDKSANSEVFPLLEKLYQKNQESLDVGEKYARWLYSLFIKKSTGLTQSAEEKLEMLSERFPNSEKITSLCNCAKDFQYLLQYCQSIACQDPSIAKDELKKLSALFPSKSVEAWEDLGAIAFEFYAEGKYPEAEILFYAASLANTQSRINLAYMIRRGECRLFTPKDAQAFLNIETNDPFVLINYALFLALEEHNWVDAQTYMKKLDSQDLTSAIEWWRALHERGDAEGTLVMAWLATLGLNNSIYKAELPKLKQNNYPDLRIG